MSVTLSPRISASLGQKAAKYLEQLPCLYYYNHITLIYNYSTTAMKLYLLASVSVVIHFPKSPFLLSHQLV